MSNNDIYQIVIPIGAVLGLGLLFFVLGGEKRKQMERRIARVTNRKTAMLQRGDAAMSLRRKGQDSRVPFIGALLSKLPTLPAVRERLERAGLKLPADIYLTASASIAVVIFLVTILINRPPLLGILAGIMIGVVIPHMVIGYLGARRIKKFLHLFPDAIDFIVRGLRSGLPVTESMNMVGGEMEEPIGSIFASIGESVKLGVSLEKALLDTSKKLSTTEFNFFVTSIVLQRETGGNLSEILNNLSDVLRKRFMMRMKIKAMASEAKASAIIVGSLPFVVILALIFVSPGYLDPFVNDPRGHMAAAGGVAMLLFGITIMIKMTRFEI